MDKKRIITLAGIALVLILFVQLAVRKKSRETGDYIFNGNSNIRLGDVRSFYKSINFDERSGRDYLSGKTINIYTLKFFIALELKFKDAATPEEHLEKVRDYLYEIMPHDEADALFALYKTYINYKVGLIEKRKSWGSPRNPDEAIELLHKLQEYRREVFGNEAADALFGPSVKAQEYPIRRNIIVGDKKLYAAEKEKKLDKLNSDMWGKEAGEVESYGNTYARYQEKLKIYEKDLSEMPDDMARRKKIREIRESLFTPDQVTSLDRVDSAIAEDRSMYENYRTREKSIAGEPGLDGSEKDGKIRALQDEMYGGEADAFRRRLAIERSLEGIK